MVSKITGLADFFRNISAAFLVAILIVLGIILFSPEEIAKDLAVYEFRNGFRIYLGPTFLLALFFGAARVFKFIMKGIRQRKNLKIKYGYLHKLTPEEKGYLLPYIKDQQNSIYVGMDDGVMLGLQHKKITYSATSLGSVVDGFAFNIQPWAKEYLDMNPYLLDGYVGRPLSPRQKFRDVHGY